jgi:hypothetical protein
MIIKGILERSRNSEKQIKSIFFNTGFERKYDQGYLSHEGANEFVYFLKKLFPVQKQRLKLMYGLEPLEKLNAIKPLVNLEVLSTKKLNNMFNEGTGIGIGIKIDLARPSQLEKLKLFPYHDNTFWKSFIL